MKLGSSIEEININNRDNGRKFVKYFEQITKNPKEESRNRSIIRRKIRRNRKNKKIEGSYKKRRKNKY